MPSTVSNQDRLLATCWTSAGDAASDRIRYDLLRAAETLGARHVKVTPDGDDARWATGTPPPLRRHVPASTSTGT